MTIAMLLLIKIEGGSDKNLASRSGFLTLKAKIVFV